MLIKRVISSIADSTARGSNTATEAIIIIIIIIIIAVMVITIIM
jgi:hypothetical protein